MDCPINLSSANLDKVHTQNQPLSNKKNQCLYLIKSRSALNIWTRLIFAVTVLMCTTVISASIWLMLDCRKKIRPMRSVMYNNDQNCTNMGLHVMFACCVALFAVFGLGCIGRQMTGYAMLIISGVAIFQSTMNLVFNECKTEVKDEFLASITSSLQDCRLGTNSPPFELKGYTFPAHQKQTKGDKYEITLRKNKEFGGNRKKGRPESKIEYRKMRMQQLAKQSEIQENDLLIMQIVDILQLEKKHNSVKSLNSACDKDSVYTTILALFLPKEHVDRCMKLCQTHHDFCKDTEVNAFSKDFNSTTNQTTSNEHIRGTAYDKSHKDDTDKSQKSNFENMATSCSRKIWSRIHRFCFYNNAIFMPLSLGGPIFYIFLSLAFMYLGHCDKVLLSDESKLDSIKSSSPRRSHSLVSTLTETFVTRTSTTTNPDKSKMAPDDDISPGTPLTSRYTPGERTSFDASSGQKYDHYGLNDSLIPIKASLMRIKYKQYLCVPSSSVSSNITLEQYICDGQ